MFLRAIPGEYAIVAKVNVSNLATSSAWYEQKLGFILDPRFTAPTWMQLNAPNIDNFAMGLNLDPQNIGTGGGTTTIVVANITQARQALLELGVQVTEIIPVGNGVQLAFFKDPDGNQLGLRQNGPNQPSPQRTGAR